MSAALTHSPSIGPATNQRPKRSAPPKITRPVLTGLAIFVSLAAIGLAVSLVTGATSVFNVLVWLLFAVLWIAFLAALAFSPATLDQVWHSLRRLPLPIEAVAWLLFLPITLGLWIWQRGWAAPIRLILLITLAAWNLFVFFPRR